MVVLVIILAKQGMLVLFAVIAITIRHKVQKLTPTPLFGDVKNVILIRN